MEVERHAVVSSVVVLLCDTAKGMYMKKKKRLFLEELKPLSKKTQACCLRIVKKDHVRQMAKKPTPVMAPLNWCYALVKLGTKTEPWHEVREVTHRKGKIVSCCDSPVTVGAESPKDVLKMLRRIIRDIKGSPFIS